MGVDKLGIGLYSPKVAARVAKIRYTYFQAWAKANLVRPAFKIQAGKRVENVYSYNDLLLIRLIVRLREMGFRTNQIKKALQTITAMYDGDRHAWMKATICVDRDLIVAVIPEKTEWNPIVASKGPQKMAVVFFPELIKELQAELVPNRFKYIEVNPEILAGAPVIKGTRIPVEAVAVVKRSGQDPRVAYPELTEEQVEEAQAYEEFLEAA